MLNITGKREIIETLRNVTAERELTSYDKIHEFVEDKLGKGVISRSTIARVFAKGSEESANTFNFETTLKPLCDALLDIKNDETDDSVDVLAYKSLLRYKSELLDEYKDQNTQLKNEINLLKETMDEQVNQVKLQFLDQIQKETESFQKSMDFVRNQIILKDNRIDDLLSDIKVFLDTNRELTRTNNELTKINNELVHGLMNCPLRKQEEKE